MRTSSSIATLSLVALFLLPSPCAYAMSRDVKTVLKAGGYGVVGGTLLGLLTAPVSKSVGTVFIGSSVGLYLGLVVGFYHVYNRDDEQNPLRQSEDSRGKFSHYDRMQLQPSPEPTSPFEELAPYAEALSPSPYRASLPEIARITIPVFRF